MIDFADIASFDRYKHSSPFTGSYKGMRFRIVHPKPAEGEEDIFIVDVYPGPYCYEKTPDEQKERTTFPYSIEGYEQIAPYLNQYYNDHTDKWMQGI